MPDAATRLAGYWRWISMRIEFADGSPGVDRYGTDPQGGVVFTEGGRIMALIAAPDRRTAESDADRAALFRSFAAYTGRFRQESETTFATEVDATWDPAWSGVQRREFSIDGDTLHVRTSLQTHPSFPGKELWMIGVARRTED